MAIVDKKDLYEWDPIHVKTYKWTNTSCHAQRLTNGEAVHIGSDTFHKFTHLKRGNSTSVVNNLFTQLYQGNIVHQDIRRPRRTSPFASGNVLPCSRVILSAIESYKPSHIKSISETSSVTWRINEESRKKYRRGRKRNLPCFHGSNVAGLT